MPANLKVWVVVIEVTEGTGSGCIDHVFYHEDSAQARKAELNEKFERIGMREYAYVAERNVF